MRKKNELEKKHPALKGFFQHGYNPTGETGSDQLVGNCIFCGKDGHFYINPKVKKWDCKKCGRSGGFKTWLKEIVDWSQQFFCKAIAINLGRDRGIKLSVLREERVGFNPLTKEYLVPVFGQNREDVWDIKRYIKGRFWSTAGCKKSLYGWDRILDAHTVWLCEGEWDALMCRTFLNNESIVSVAVPGGDIFMQDWTQLFANKKVYVVYDNDETGTRGMNKVYKMLTSLVSDIQFIHWPDSKPDGYDLRDYCNEKKSLHSILTFFQPLPPGLEEGEGSDAIGIDSGKYTGEGLPHEEVYKEFKSIFEMNDTSVLDVMYGTIVANRLDGDPLWLFLVGPPGSLKSELLMTLVDCPAILTTTSVTPHSLVSGANFSGGGDPSLIPRLNGKVLIMKDFTTILNMNPTARDDIFGILRDAYDGRTEKVFGNGVTRVYESKFGIVAGVTPAIELYIEGNTAMGERFLSYRIPVVTDLSEQRAMVKRAILNVGTEKDKRKRLKEVSHKVLNYNFDSTPMINDCYVEKIISLAQWISIMRGTIVRDKFSKEITHKPFTEYATRLSKQLCKLLMGICMFKRIDKVTDKEFRIIQCIAHSTVPGRMLDICGLAVKAEGEELELADCTKGTGLPRVTCERTLEDLALLKILDKVKVGKLSNKWKLRKDIIDLLKGADLYD